MVHPFPTGFRLDCRRNTVTCGSRCPGSVLAFLALFTTLAPILLSVSVRVRVEKWEFRHFDDPSLSQGEDGRQSEGIA